VIPGSTLTLLEALIRFIEEDLNASEAGKASK